MGQDSDDRLETEVTVRPTLVVMADGRRQHFVDQLLASLDAPARVVYDLCDCDHGRPQCPLEGHRDRWRTGARALLAGLDDPEASHIVCIQDDAVVCRDFLPAATKALEQVPDQPVSFYAGKPRPQDATVARKIRDARQAGSSWMRFEGPWWGVCVALPVALIRPAVASADTFTKVANYDVRLARGLMRLGYQCLYTLPSLADHRQGHPSLIPGGRPQGRRAHWFVGEDVSGLTIDWTPYSVPAPGAGFIQELANGRTVYRCGVAGCHYRTSAKHQIQRHSGQRHPGGRMVAR